MPKHLNLTENEQIAPIVYAFHNLFKVKDIEEVLDTFPRFENWTLAAWDRYSEMEQVGRVNLENRDVKIFRPEQVKLVENSFIEAQLNKLVFEKFGLRFASMSNITACHYTAGCHVRSHSDTDSAHGNRLVTFVLFLKNDCTGGELEFPQFDVNISGEAGTLVLFPSETLHSVKPVLSGERISLVWFGVN